MIKGTEKLRDALLLLGKKRIYLEGNILKLIKPDSDDKELSNYIEFCKNKDSESRRKRLEVTKQVQAQNKELEKAAIKNNHLMDDLQEALKETQLAKAEAEKLRDQAMEDLDSLQKKTQFELISLIVKIALAIIIGVGIVTTILYVFLVMTGNPSQIVESAWSNMFGILLTNSFSIIGTIMGVKYATENKK